MEYTSISLSRKNIFLMGIIFLLFLAGCRQYHKLEKDIPVYKGAKFVRLFDDTSNKEKEHELWTVKASIDDVSQFYQSELKDKKWKKEMIVPSPDGSGYALAYIKKKKMLTVIVFARAGKENEAYIDLSVVSAPD